MKSRSFLIKLFFSVLTVAIVFYNFSSGPGQGGQQVTGAPGEGTCVNCHSSFPLNSGTGSFSVSGLTGYTPGNTYTLTVTLSDPNAVYYGFQMVALRTSNNTTAGSFTAGSGTQVVTLSGRQYIEHNSPNAGGVFTFSWTAPATDVGNITFYAAGNAANANNNTSGDRIYTTTHTITPNATPPVANFTANNTTICQGGVTTFTSTSTGGPTSYSWNFGAGAVPATASTQGPHTVMYTTSGTKTISLIVTNSAGSDTETKTNYVTVNANPTVNVSPASNTVCAGIGTSLTASGALNYSWSPSAGLSSTTGVTVTATPTSTTTYTVTGTDGNGCSGTATATITVNPIPNITITPATTAVCAGDSATLTASGAVSYSWAPSTGLSATTGAVVKASPPSTTTYTVTGTNANNCVNTQTVTVTIVAPPTVTVTSITPSICLGGSATLMASGASSYTWSPGASLNTTTGATVIATPTSTTTYTVIGISGTGCSDTAFHTLMVNPLPTITASSSGAICAGDSATLTATGGVSYNWSPSAGLGSTSGASVKASPAANTTYTVTATDINGCSSTAIVSVTVNPIPNIAVSPLSATICTGDTVDITATGAVSYAWSPSATLSASTGATVKAFPNTNTTYTVTGTGANNCTASTTVTVNALMNITVQVSPNTSICIGDTASLTATGATTYSWKPSGLLISATGATVMAIPTATTTYTVIGTGGSASCADTQFVTVTVDPLPIADAGADAAICSGSNVQLQASGGVTYLWSPAASLSSPGIADPTASPQATTTYTVLVTSTAGCEATDEVTITVNPLPSVSFGQQDTTICIGDSITVTPTGAVNYTITPAPSTPFVLAPTATTQYILEGTDANSCTNFDTLNIAVDNLPAKPSVLVNGDTLTSSVTATAYIWYLNGNVIPAANGQTYIITETGLYSVAVINSSGCINTSDQVTVEKIGIEEVSGLSQAKIYPNPAGNILFLELPQITGSPQVEIYDNIGRLHIYFDAEQGINNIDISGLAPGIYTVKVKASNDSHILKVIKN